MFFLSKDVGLHTWFLEGRAGGVTEHGPLGGLPGLRTGWGRERSQSTRSLRPGKVLKQERAMIWCEC